MLTLFHRLLSLIFAALLLLTLAACAPSTPPITNEPSEPTSDDPAVTDPVVTDPTEPNEPTLPAEPDPLDAVNKVTPALLLEVFEARTYTAKDGTTLPYRLYVPHNYDASKSYPVLLFLHGAGARGNDNSTQFQHVVTNLFNVYNTPVKEAIVIVPQCPANEQWVDTPWEKGNYRLADVPISNELTAVMEILDSIRTDYSTDTDRYYVMGLSMGGFGTWDLLMRYPDVFAAAVPFCGGADPIMADALVDMPIWTFHGDADTSVPVDSTRAMVAAIQAAGGSAITYEEKAGVGHDVWTQGSTRTEVICWLFEQTLADR